MHGHTMLPSSVCITKSLHHDNSVCVCVRIVQVFEYNVFWPADWQNAKKFTYLLSLTPSLILTNNSDDVNCTSYSIWT